jgi:putative acetyltransferase
MQETVEIIDYTPQYKEDFKRLNVEWISAYFTLEAHELEMLDNPEGYILSKGGKIFFAKKGDDIIGTCAIIKLSETTYELVKMGVSPQYQGLGAGKKLGLRAIEVAKELGCTYLFLESNQKLTPALTMYKALGFVEVPMGETPYVRADFKGEMYL